MSNKKKRFVIRIRRSHQPIRLVTIFAFLIVVCLPFHTITVSGVGLLMLLGIPLMALSIPALLSCFRRTSWDKATVLLACYFGYNLLAYAWTPSFSAYSVYNFVKIIAIVVCLYCHTYNRREQRLLLAGSLISCLIVCWFMLTETNVGYDSNRMTIAVFGVVQDPNYIGYLFLIPMAVVITAFMHQKGIGHRLVWGFLAGLILLCVMITGSRGALLGVMVVVIVCVINRFKSFGAKIAFCGAMLLLALILYGFVLSLLPEHIVARFSIQDIIETRGTKRWDLWLKAFHVMQGSPHKIFLGFGMGSSHYLLGGWATHNFFIQLLLEVGVVGLVLFLGFSWNWYNRLLKHDTMGLSIFLGCLAMAMTLSVNTIYYFWFAFILGIVCSDARPTREGG